MNKNKTHKIHYINTSSISNNSFNINNSVGRKKNISHQRIKNIISGDKKLKLTETADNSSTNINRRIANILFIDNTKKDVIKLSKGRKKHAYHFIFYSKENIVPLSSRVSNSVDRIKLNNFRFNGITPKKQKRNNIKSPLKENITNHQRCMTVTDIKKRKTNFHIKKVNEIKIVKKEKIVNNIYKNIKFQTKLSPTKLVLDGPKNIEKNKNKFDKIKKVVKKMKYDLSTVNGIESKQERIRNLLFGVSYMTEKKECELCHKIVDRHTYQFHYYSHPSPILKWMFLGTFKNANNIEEIRILGIKYILNCAIEIKPKNLPKDIKYCQLNISDSSSSDITKYFEPAFSFIELARKKNQKILIHCKLGVSRSPTILIGYLIKYMGYSTKLALDFLKSKRSQVHPNSGFISQLYSFERNTRKNIIEYISPSITYSTTDFSLTTK